MRVQMRRVEHDALGLWTFGGEADENPVEDAKPAPANETVVECLVRPVALGRILPLKAVPDDVDNAADDASVVDPRHATLSIYCRTLLPTNPRFHQTT